MPDSDSEDDFMSDKFLTATLPTTKETQTYTSKRSAQQLKSLRAGQAKNPIPLKQLEEQRRRKGLSKSLFESDVGGSGGGTSAAGGGGVAVGLMMKMGWKVGEGLGKRRSPSPPSGSRTTSVNVDDEEDDQPRRGGIGSTSSSGASKPQARIEPLRVSMWSKRKGLTARSPSPPPLPPSISGRNVDALDPKKLERLGRETEDFRTRQRREFMGKEIERKESKAREMLIKFDEAKGIKFHPLHVLPSDPLGTLPKPLLRLIYPAQALSPSRSRSSSPIIEPIEGFGRANNLSAAEKLRDQMRKDMLSEMGVGDSDDDDEILNLGKRRRDSEDEEERRKRKKAQEVDREAESEEKKVDWEAMVSGTKKVLNMDPSSHLAFLVSQLRYEHLYCFWCAYKYNSYDEMDGPGGCPGEEEDDH